MILLCHKWSNPKRVSTIDFVLHLDLHINYIIIFLMYNFLILFIEI
jgi:hypothetical protein